MCEANCVLLITSVLVERDWIMIFERLSSVGLRQKHFFQGIWSLGGKGEGRLCLWRTDPRALITCYIVYVLSFQNVQTWVLTFWVNWSLFTVYSASLTFRQLAASLGYFCTLLSSQLFLTIAWNYNQCALAPLGCLCLPGQDPALWYRGRSC